MQTHNRLTKLRKEKNTDEFCFDINKYEEELMHELTTSQTKYDPKIDF